MISTVVFGTTPLAGVILFLLALLIVVQWTERERSVVSLCTADREREVSGESVHCRQRERG